MTYKNFFINGVLCTGVWAVGNFIFFLICQWFNVFYLFPAFVRLMLYSALFVLVNIVYFIGLYKVYDYGRRIAFYGNLVIGSLLFFCIHFVILSLYYMICNSYSSAIGLTNWWFLIIKIIIDALREAIPLFEKSTNTISKLIDKCTFSFFINAALTLIPNVVMYLSIKKTHRNP